MDVIVIQDENVTAVQIDLTSPTGLMVSGVGTAQRYWADKHDPEMGYCIATARALEDAARQLRAVVHPEEVHQDGEASVFSLFSYCPRWY